MMKNFETRLTGWFFIAAAALLWVGWALSPHHIEEYIKSEDFTAIGENVWYWIWMFRVHIFGWVALAVALFAFLSVTSKRPFGVLLTPGAGMVIAGSYILAIGSAFYYNFGAWGVGKTMGKSPEEIQEFMDGILYTNQYVTCFFRFGRVFSGLGLVLLGSGLVKWNIVKTWLGWLTIALGLAAMGIVMLIPEHWEIYKPVFHVKVVWSLLMGIMLLMNGVNLSKAVSSSE